MDFMKTQRSSRLKGFTLIELLIVVAIIAILAAIAVPNFLEAQVRSKVSRTLADVRSMRTALESYAVDNNRYPETDLGVAPLATVRPYSILRLTTPIAYMTSIPASPWKEKYGFSGSPKIAQNLLSYLYVRRAVHQSTVLPATPATPRGADNNYVADRLAYYWFGIAPSQLAAESGEWLIKSVGPDNEDDRDLNSGTRPGWSPTLARVYDPTNGTVSLGDIVVFNDRPGTGKN
jgi:type II secretion system protein G